MGWKGDTYHAPQQAPLNGEIGQWGKCSKRRLKMHPLIYLLLETLENTRKASVG